MLTSAQDGAPALVGRLEEQRLLTSLLDGIPPPAQRAMSERAGATVVEAAGSHSIYVSQPGPTAELIELAARQALVKTPQTA